jgi:hypothetical protein
VTSNEAALRDAAWVFAKMNNLTLAVHRKSNRFELRFSGKMREMLLTISVTEVMRKDFNASLVTELLETEWQKGAHLEAGT